MAERPGITIVGAGNLASALAPALHRAGYEIDGIVARSGAASKARAKALARAVNSAVISPAQVKSRIVWLCVPDGEIARAARTLAAAIEWNGRVALHSSGALSSHELAVLQRRGAAAGSVHPLMTFVHGSRPSLAGVPFAVEGDARAARTARAIVRKLRGQAFSIGRREKVAYHAWGMFASPAADGSAGRHRKGSWGSRSLRQGGSTEDAADSRANHDELRGAGRARNSQRTHRARGCGHGEETSPSTCSSAGGARGLRCVGAGFAVLSAGEKPDGSGETS